MMAALDEYGRVDAVLNVAGIGGPQRIRELPWKTMTRLWT